MTAARITVANQTDSLDFVYTPRMTPSRIPLLDQRWVITPQEAQGIPLIDGGAQYPGGGQYGVRWNHLAKYLEYSFSYFRGYNNLPLLQADFIPALGAIEVLRQYVHLQSVGADTAIPLPWITLKAEAAYFGSDTPQTNEYVLYVVQAERQWHEWLFIVGYTGEYDTEVRNVLALRDPERECLLNPSLGGLPGLSMPSAMWPLKRSKGKTAPAFTASLNTLTNAWARTGA